MFKLAFSTILISFMTVLYGCGGDDNTPPPEPPVFLTERVSVDSSGDQGNHISTDPSISFDGRYVAFKSLASDLVAGDTNSSADIFVHDRLTGETMRVSVASDGSEANGHVYFTSISADGRYVAFDSLANDLVTGDTNGVRDVFVHDRDTGETKRVSLASDGSEVNSDSTNPKISGNGRHVVFLSNATDLVTNDTNGLPDVYVHDLDTGTTTRVSVASDGTQADGSSTRTAISGDGHFVAYRSSATTLVPVDTNDFDDIFIHDRDTGTTLRVSEDENGVGGNGHSGFPALSADGRYVGYSSNARNVVVGDGNMKGDVFLYDRVTMETITISVASDGSQGNHYSYSPSISDDNRYVSFHSLATNLVTGDTNDADDIFVHDLVTGATSRISLANDGITQGNGVSTRPLISGDGRNVVFISYASNLVAGDTNGYSDIFVRQK